MPPSSATTALASLSKEQRREYWAALALRHTEGLGPRCVCALLSHFGSAWDAVQNPHDWDEAGIPARKVQAFLDDSWRERARPEWEAARSFQGHIILWTDERYPQCLKALYDAPALLYAIGDTALLDAPSVALVGSRNASQAAMDFADIVAEGLSSSGVTVVSGMAFGVDGRAHRSALRGPGRTIAVLAGGADVPYPASHSELWRKIAAQGLIVSEYAPGTPVHKKTFPHRNRIVSGLSLGVMMVEAANEKSGSLITARLAAEQGRTVYVPAPDALHGNYAEGTKQLLMDGARPVWQAGDILADLFSHLRHALKTMPKVPAAPHHTPAVKVRRDAAPMPQRKSAHPESISHDLQQESSPTRPVPASAGAEPEECVLLGVLGSAPLSPDDLLLAVQELDAAWTAPRLLATLMVMEVKRLVRRRSDSRYEVCP